MTCFIPKMAFLQKRNESVIPFPENTHFGMTSPAVATRTPATKKANSLKSRLLIMVIHTYTYNS